MSRHRIDVQPKKLKIIFISYTWLALIIGISGIKLCIDNRNYDFANCQKNNASPQMSPTSQCLNTTSNHGYNRVLEVEACLSHK